LRIVLTIAGLTPESGGPSRSVPALAESLAGEGLEVDLLSLDFGKRESPPLLPRSERIQTRFIPCRLSRRIPTLWAWNFRKALERCVIEKQAALIHDNGLWLPTNHIAARTARVCNVPLVLSPRGMLNHWSLNAKSWRKKLAWSLHQKRALEVVSMFHLTSAQEVEDVRALGFSQPCAVIPNGVNLPQVASSRRLANGDRTLLFLSRIHPKKGLRQLVEAWARLRPRGWRVTIAGTDENGHQAELQRLMHEKGVGDDFHFPGPVDGQPKWELYQNADLFVLPSHSENFGIVIAEALASGTPVITTKGTPWPELLEHRCGWWIDPNVDALASALKEAMSLSIEERMKMGARGRSLVEARYTWPAAAREMRAAYGWLLRQGEKPACIVD
jgi:glycosyltransferase involved in cell wall biosynthesis